MSAYRSDGCYQPVERRSLQGDQRIDQTDYPQSDYNEVNTIKLNNILAQTFIDETTIAVMYIHKEARYNEVETTISCIDTRTHKPKWIQYIRMSQLVQFSLNYIGIVEDKIIIYISLVRLFTMDIKSGAMQTIGKSNSDEFTYNITYIGQVMTVDNNIVFTYSKRTNHAICYDSLCIVNKLGEALYRSESVGEHIVLYVDKQMVDRVYYANEKSIYQWDYKKEKSIKVYTSTHLGRITKLMNIFNDKYYYSSYDSFMRINHKNSPVKFYDMIKLNDQHALVKSSTHILLYDLIDDHVIAKITDCKTTSHVNVYGDMILISIKHTNKMIFYSLKRETKGIK